MVILNRHKGRPEKGRLFYIKKAFEIVNRTGLILEEVLYLWAREDKAGIG